MFARIMAVVLAIILLTTVCLSAVWWLTLRNQQIDARLDYLNSQAEEIAYLAGNLSGDNLMDTIRDRDSVTRVYLNRMSARVSEEFEAFIMLMDENGNMMIYDQARKTDDTEFRESLDSEEIAGAFQRIEMLVHGLTAAIRIARPTPGPPRGRISRAWRPLRR